MSEQPTEQQRKNRRLILIIFAMSIIPLMIAALLRTSQFSLGSTNYGKLVVPPIVTRDDKGNHDFSGADTFSVGNMGELSGHWLIANVIPTQHCAAVCLDALLKTHQLRMMLNKELSRTRRVAILFQEPDTTLANQWWLKDSLLSRLRKTQQAGDEQLFNQLLNEENVLEEPLITKLIGNDNREFALNSDVIRVKPSAVLIQKLTALRQGSLPEGILLLIDPLGNIMMQYDAGFDVYKVKADLMHLLKASQIG